MISSSPDTGYANLPTIKPYTPTPVVAAPSPVGTYNANKLNMLRQNEAQYMQKPTGPVTIVTPGALDTPPPAPDQTPWAESGAASSPWNTNPVTNAYNATPQTKGAPLQQPLKREDIMKQLATQSPATVSANAQQIDPEYKAFVDHYKTGGAMSQLPDSIQKNFDQFALNTHYMGKIASERMPDMQALGLRTEMNKAPKDAGQFVANVATAIPTVLGGGLVDALTQSISDLVDPMSMADRIINQKDQGSDHFARLFSKAVEPYTGASYESQVQTAAHQAELLAMMVPGAGKVLSAGISGIAGAADATAQGAKQGNMNPGDIATEAGKQVLFNLGGKALAGKAFSPLAGTNFMQRILNAGAQGAQIAPILTGAGQAIDLARGKVTGGEAVNNTLASIPMGFLTAAGFQTGIEGLNGVTNAYHTYQASRNSPAAQNYKDAIARDPNARQPLNEGVPAPDIKMIQDLTPDEVAAAKQVNEIARTKMTDKLTQQNLYDVAGEKTLNQLQAVADAQDAAGAKLGEIRKSLSTEPISTTADAESAFVSKLPIGVNIDDAGNISVGNRTVPKEATGYLTEAWSLLPDEQQTSPQNIDAIRSKLGKIIGEIPNDPQFGSTRNAIGALYHGLGDQIQASLPPELAQQFKDANGTYSDALDILHSWSRQLRTKDDFKPLSVSDVKNLLSTGDRATKIGNVARRLLGNAEGMYMPAFNSLQGFVNTNKFVPPEAAAEDVNIFNLAKYTDTVEKVLKLQNPTSLAGEVKGATVSKGGPVASTWSTIKSVFAPTAWSQFQAMDRYLNVVGSAPAAEAASGNIAAEAQNYQQNQDAQAQKMQQSMQFLKNAGDAEQLAPEEKATGLIGGGGENLPRTANLSADQKVAYEAMVKQGIPAQEAMQEIMGQDTTGGAGLGEGGLSDKQGLADAARATELGKTMSVDQANAQVKSENAAKIKKK